MLRCHDATHLIASDEFTELGFWRRLELRLHLMMCRHCRNYENQIRSLGSGARRLFGDTEPTDHELRHLENEICDRICPGGKHP